MGVLCAMLCYGRGWVMRRGGSEARVIMQIRRAAPLSQSYQSSGEDVIGIMSGYWRCIASGTDLTPPRAHAVQCAVHRGRNGEGAARAHPRNPSTFFGKNSSFIMHFGMKMVLPVRFILAAKSPSAR